ncbi:helix-turn-helix transcriptional regulator [Hazenella sp. IB182353]|uniref:helix-turn-helix transcriptional regulator n=1 Tax=Polycladospora coralii TaxID=2771432 RepID=UPI0017466E31|nr:helix-turn-helix transcriptional regulator [Polycladospora coralii]MBS7531852.1 helix-turn-helix transcriptional regulator [Polycladospora coralii]
MKVTRVELRTKRKQLGLSQKKLAKKLGVTVQHVSDIEWGIKSPSLELALKIARTLDNTVEFFFGKQSA